MSSIKHIILFTLITINYSQCACICLVFFLIRFIWQKNRPNLLNMNAFGERAEDIFINLSFNLLYQILYLWNVEKKKIMQKKKKHDKSDISWKKINLGLLIKGNILVYIIFFLFKCVYKCLRFEHCFIWCQRNTFKFSLRTDSKPIGAALWPKDYRWDCKAFPIITAE